MDAMPLMERLDQGLMIRHATAADAEALHAFNGAMHADPGIGFDRPVAEWTRDILTRPQPASTPADVMIIEDGAGKIASSIGLFSQTWSYGGVPIGVGQIEAVATDPAYRRRGLVRRQFDIAHRWSAERGELVQVISGIPWYYRQFGYEYALAMGGGRSGFAPHLPAPTSEPQPYCVRPATVADLPFIERLDATARERYLVTCIRTPAMWRHELDGRGEGSFARREFGVVETATGERAGYIAHMPAAMWGGTMTLVAYELARGHSWQTATLAVLRYLAATGEAYAASGGTPFQAFHLRLGTEHPAYDAIPNRLRHVAPPYAWYVRVPDIAAFIRRVAPVLERRLAASAIAGYSGSLLLNFYRDGLVLTFADGRLTAAERWLEPDRDQAGASFIDLTFLKLLFGYRSLEDVEHAFIDCYTRTEEARVLVKALFPPQPSFVWQMV